MTRRHYNPWLKAWYWSVDGVDWYCVDARNPPEAV